MSDWIETHIPCPSCGSSDAASINSKGFLHCFSCGANIKVDEGDEEPLKPRVHKKTPKGLAPTGEFRALTKRMLSEETCRKFQYSVGRVKGKMAQIAPYRKAKGGDICAQKIRFANKEFITTGSFDKVGLFGKHLWGEGGKRVVITEGEIDCMTVSQLQGNKWPVVSLPCGAQAAPKAIKDNLEWLLTFEEIVILFDMDEVGRKASVEAAELLPLGLAKIAELPLKDPNEMLLAGKGQEVINAIWNAKEYRPDGIVDIDELIEEIEKPVEWGLPWFLPTLTNYTYGRQYGAIYGFGAGTGVGKTDLFTQQMA